MLETSDKLNKICLKRLNSRNSKNEGLNKSKGSKKD